MDHTLELAQIPDAAAIAGMSRQLIEVGLAPSWPTDRILRHIKHADSVVLVAKAHGVMLGFAIMQFGDETAHLNLLAVSPGTRRRGIGRHLVTWLEETAIVAGTFIIQLELRSTNDSARTFYEALGYQETARVRGYYQLVEDAIRMERDLRVGRTTQT